MIPSGYDDPELDSFMTEVRADLRARDAQHAETAEAEPGDCLVQIVKEAEQ